MKKTMLILLLCLVICFVGCKQDVDTVKTSAVLEEKYSCEIPNLEANVFTTKWGNIYTTCKASDFFGTFGFTWGDFVTVRFLDQELVLPVVPNYYYVDTGEAAIIIEKGDDGTPRGYLSMAIYMGNFTSTYGIGTKVTNEDNTWYWVPNEGVSFPITVEFEMYEQGGYPL